VVNKFDGLYDKRLDTIAERDSQTETDGHILAKTCFSYADARKNASFATFVENMESSVVPNLVAIQFGPSACAWPKRQTNRFYY